MTSTNHHDHVYTVFYRRIKILFTGAAMTQTYRNIAFQGAAGAFSDVAVRHMYPNLERLPCRSFEDAFMAVRDKTADLAMIPIDNTLAGRVADVHHLIPRSQLHIIGEWFEPIRMCLLGVPGAKIGDVRDVYSHVHAIPQCRKVLAELKVTAHVHKDTAGAVMDVAQWADKSKAAIGSHLAAEIYGLHVLREDIHDEQHNTTRFIVFAREPLVLQPHDPRRMITSLLFEVRNIPAALYKAMGGFATNGVQMTKLESYVGAGFNVARFFADVEGHPDQPALARALEELRFFAADVQVLGTYPVHALRVL
jgi:prephenate dehydratase